MSELQHPTIQIWRVSLAIDVSLTLSTFPPDCSFAYSEAPLGLLPPTDRARKLLRRRFGSVAHSRLESCAFRVNMTIQPNKGTNNPYLKLPNMVEL